METTDTQAYNNTNWLKTCLFMPIGCLLSISPYVIFGGLIAALIGGVYAYYNINTDLLGFGRPDFANIVFDHNYQNVQGKDQRWYITYEKKNYSVFTGKVRHVSPIHEMLVPFLTHDILITTGDFADPKKVDTSVANHHFTWAALNQQKPSGTINLLHVVPMNEEIYNQLLQIRGDQQVSITGLEVLKIDAFDKSGALSGTWQDAGCNSIVVTSVIIDKSQ